MGYTVNIFWDQNQDKPQPNPDELSFFLTSSGWAYEEGVIDEENLTLPLSEAYSESELEAQFTLSSWRVGVGSYQEGKKLCEQIKGYWPHLEVKVEEVPKYEAPLLPAIQGGRFWICPPWDLKPGALVVNPAMAFGTGHHESTRLVLSMMEEIGLLSPFLDMGTGTGVLALAAATEEISCVAVDYDEASLEQARENEILTRNHRSLKGSIQWEKGSIESWKPTPSRRFKMITANILLGVLIQGSDNLKALCDHRGWLILSGLRQDQKDLMLKALEGFTLHKEREEKGWICLALQNTDFGSGENETKGSGQS